MGFSFSEDGKTVYKYKGSESEITIPEGVMVIDSNVFCKCDSLHSVTFPLSLIKICKWSFGKCNNLTSVIFNDSLREIESFAFADCSSLNKISLNNGLKTIGESAFRGCNSITDIVIPDSVEYIAPRAFENCESLKTIVLGKGIKKIEDYTFWNCSSLETIISKEPEITVGEMALFNCNNAKLEFVNDEIISVSELTKQHNIDEEDFLYFLTKNNLDIVDGVSGERAIKKESAENYVNLFIPNAEEIKKYRQIKAEEEKQKAIKQAEENRLAMLNKLAKHNLKGYYEYKVVSLTDERGALNTNMLELLLNNLGREGWHVVGSYANELGHNSTTGGVLGISTGTNSTVDQNVIILERFVVL